MTYGVGNPGPGFGQAQKQLFPDPNSPLLDVKIHKII
jgi:hypothetical protein